jgi:hypothetical protein
MDLQAATRRFVTDHTVFAYVSFNIRFLPENFTVFTEGYPGAEELAIQ